MDRSDAQKRLPHLDGLRGLAILAVIFFHCYSRGPDIPGLNTTLFSEGSLGVQLFFLLSGFLIFHSLETSSSLGHFLHRRWVRLFPAMVAVSFIVCATAAFLYDRMDSLPGYLDFLPGILLIDPHWLQAGLGLPVTGPIEGDFWTLFVEVKFYLLFGLIFFLGRRRAVWALAGLAALGLAVYLGQIHGYDPAAGGFARTAATVSDELNCRCYGWFAAGAFFYLYVAGRRGLTLAASALCAAAGVVASSGGAGLADVACCAGVYVVFVTPFFWARLASFFSQPAWVFFGFISYPLYLLHQNVTWAVALKLHRAFPGVPAKLVMLAPLLLVCLLAYLIAADLEPLGRRLLAAGRKAPGAAPAPWRRRHLAVCAGFALVAALGSVAALLHPVRDSRRVLEERTLAFDRAALAPLVAKLAENQEALGRVQAARIQAQAYLDGLRRAGP